MGRDYTPSNGTITFSPAILQQIINITIIDDESVEDIEMFIVHLSGAPTNVILSPSQASVAIIDNDGRCGLVNWLPSNRVALSSFLSA